MVIPAELSAGELLIGTASSPGAAGPAGSPDPVPGKDMAMGQRLDGAGRAHPSGAQDHGRAIPLQLVHPCHNLAQRNVQRSFHRLERHLDVLGDLARPRLRPARDPLDLRDPVGGLPDLRARRLRFVGDPDARITEDYLRILRFFRFHARYGRAGAADAGALAACARHADGLAGISRERIGAEMRKLLSAPDPSEAVRLMEDAGVLDIALPGARAAGLASCAKAAKRSRHSRKPDK